jgi:predicted dienelactone hydrolase
MWRVLLFMKTISSFFWMAALAFVTVGAKSAEYDPLEVGKAEVKSEIFDVWDEKRGRTIPIRVYLPDSEEPAPVILFSHGLGGSRDNNPYLGNHWAKRGYAVVFIQHPGSDESVWKDERAGKRMAAMKLAASPKNFMARNNDVPAVIDALEAWNGEKGHALEDVFDISSIGMSGHSFGAVTTQAMAGQAFAGGRISYTEERIDAALMMSPSSPKRGDPAEAFGNIRIPCLLMTGTLDDSPIGDTTPASRLLVFPALTNAPAWQVVFDEATHMSFGERDLAGKSIKGSRYHEAILALSTAFWDAELRGDNAARAWLNGEGAEKALVSKDEWEINERAK